MAGGEGVRCWGERVGGEGRAVGEAGGWVGLVFVWFFGLRWGEVRGRGRMKGTARRRGRVSGCGIGSVECECECECKCE